MMDWQQPLALAVVALAAVWLVRTQILSPRRGGCGGCKAHGPKTTPHTGSTQLVQIDLEPPGSRPKT